ncbi:hypothetical protein [Methylobacterium brachiatum]|uniref:hypothetical protein n=1 Tax=Methylobacterium brachiatum TaxID=269660 RepID=UPI000B89B5E5|nr:hypothetical protein [Methylobacterium brachiatum]
MFFRAYKEVAFPLYEALITELCGSPHLPFQLATTLEDIGQAFIRLAEQVNTTLKRRGILDLEVEADSTIEAQIEAILIRLAKEERLIRSPVRGQAIPALTNETVQQAIRIALLMTHDLPIAGEAARRAR